MALPRVFTIPASAPFLTVLVDALLDGAVVPGFAPRRDPLALAAATLYLPTRRACRLAREVLLDAFGEAAVLPRIVPIGDIDEDEIVFAQAASGALAETALDIPEALSGLERRLLLAQLITRWADMPGVRGAGGAPLVANTPAAVVQLADALARLIDDMATRRVPWQRLDDLVPHDLDEYWQKTLGFLQIARTAWPARLAELERSEAAERRDRLIAAEIGRLKLSDAPVIAAGSTGSMPATADLLAAIARLPHGAVVLPGLDTDLDNAGWDAIAGDADAPPHDGGIPAFAHPQFALHGLLERIGILRRDVARLGAPATHGRDALLSQALRPTATTERWRDWLRQPEVAQHRAQAMRDVTVIEAATADEEALAIAIALRETAETPSRTAALVTPDRALARRVIAALQRWNVAVDDSGGDSLADTPAGIFARLIAEVALKGCEPVTLLALLKHPLLRLGRDAGHFIGAVEALELAVLRGPRPRPGTAGLAHALQSAPANRGTEAAAMLVAKLSDALKPLESVPAADQPFRALAARHYDCLVALGRDAQGDIPALAGSDGRALAAVFGDVLATAHADGLALAPSDYGELFQAVIADRVVRKPALPEARLRIYGPLEARLQHADRIVLGGLVEGTWPPETRSDPWLSRPMRHALGLDLPERRIGLSAHDFAQAMGAGEVILTRAAKLSGAPTVASRFVQRIAALAGEAEWSAALARGETYLQWARALDRPAAVTPVAQPSPKPPRTQRPSRLSVTQIEDWLRDPYTIYARHILKLEPLDAVDTPPGAADRGTVIHAAVAAFTQHYADALPDDPAAALIALGAQGFKALEDFPETRAFWWPRFLRIAAWFAQWERERRGAIAAVHPEVKGELAIPRRDGTFTLTGRADRIERRADGRYVLLDYKTGRLPGHNEVRVGFAPQLPLEAAMLRSGAFDGIPSGAGVAELVYVSLKGGEPAGEERIVQLKETTPDALADESLAKLTALIAYFDDEAHGYTSLVSPMWRGRRYGDYDHLARVKEWSIAEDDDA